MPLQARLQTIAAALLLAAATALQAAAPPTRPPITGIAHVALRTQNLPADRLFYTEKLGWTATASPEFPDGIRVYGDPSQSVEIHPAASASEPVLQHVGLATPDAEAMRVYLKGKRVAVPAALTTLRDGAKVFDVQDPEGNTIEFVQRVPGAPVGSKAPDSISGRIIHAGFIVRSASAEDRFYRDILGFHPYWSGGMKEGVVDWASLQVPDGTDWLEYMLNIPPNPSHHEVGVQDHFSLGVADMDTVVAKLEQRGWTPSPASQKQMGRDGKFQLNFYDPDQVRVEFMEFKPRQTPCCHPITGREPSEADR